MAYTNRDIVAVLGHQKGLLQLTKDKIDLPADGIVATIHSLIDAIPDKELDERASEDLIDSLKQVTSDALALDARVLPE